MGSLHSKNYLSALSAVRRLSASLVLMVALLSVGCSDIKPLMDQKCGTEQKVDISIVLKNTGGAIYQAVVMNESIEFQLDPNKPPQQQIKFWMGVLLNAGADIARLNLSANLRRVLESMRNCSTCTNDGSGCTKRISFDYKRFLLDEIPDLAWQFVPGKVATVINITVGVAKICGICPLGTPIPTQSDTLALMNTSDNVVSDSKAQSLYNTALFSSGSTILRVRRAGEATFARIVPAGDADGNGLVNADDIRAIITNTNVACPLAVSMVSTPKPTTDELLLQMLYMVRTGQFVPCSQQDATRIGRLTETVLTKIMRAHSVPLEPIGTSVPLQPTRIPNQPVL